MIDAADHALDVDAKAQERYEAQQAQARAIAESMKPYDPTLLVNCVDCGEDVSPERMKAMPRTRRCAECAAEVERGYREQWP